ncbi:hypothetical protein AB0M43_38650 [Longispora sp. NPDC051575]|uniref:hypothetical protein n=1 Tax=Longispora sp. NPDC051575 TaxID=3154943 RepID=UPI00341E06D4
MREELTQLRRGRPTDQLADLLWIFATGYQPMAEAQVALCTCGKLNIVPGTMLPEGWESVVTRRRLAEMLHNTGLDSESLRRRDNALVLAVVLWSLR